MEYRRKLCVKFFFSCIICALLFAFVCNPLNSTTTVYASSWTESADKSIYGKDQTIQDSSDDINDLMNPENAEKPSLPEKWLIALIKGVTDGLYKILNGIGISIDNVIYGRVGGHTKDGINIFRFELVKGNPYGVVGSVIYSIISGIAMIAIVLAAFGKFAAVTYYTTPTKKQEFKQSIGRSIVTLALLPLMPMILDLLFYIADVMLAAISKEGTLKLFGTASGFSIVETFREIADLGIINALIYFSSVALSLYFALLYCGYAMTMLVLFILFPFVCIGTNFDKSMISTWVKQVLGIILIPIMDCMLLMVPVFLGLLPRSGSMAIIKVMVCAMIVPARGVLRQVLGLGSSGLELAGVATMLAGAKFAGSVGKSIKQSRGDRRDAKNDKQMADYYDAKAKQDNEYSSSSIASTPTSIANNTAPGIAGGAISDGKTSYLGSASGTPTSSGSMGPISSGSTPMAQQGGNIADEFATVDNFLNPEIRKNLSNEKIAELYRRRAKQNNVKAVGGALGSIGGGMVAAGGTMFMSPASKMQFASMGIDAGRAIGSSINIGNGRSKKQPKIDNISAENISMDSMAQPNVIQSGGGAIIPSSEVISGTVDEHTSMALDKAGSSMSNETFLKDTKQFCYRNQQCAYEVGDQVINSYIHNDGEGLRNIYSAVSSRNRDVNTYELNSVFKNEARGMIGNDFNKNLRSSPHIKYSANSKVNEKGMNLYSTVFNRRIADEEDGVLSDNFLNTFSWYKNPNKEKLGIGDQVQINIDNWNIR